MSEITELFAEMHRENYAEAKYKVGEEVIYNPLHTNFPEFRGKKFIITGVSWADDDEQGKPVMEYSLSGFPYFVWENELEKIVDTRFCSQCGAPKVTFKCDYCFV